MPRTEDVITVDGVEVKVGWAYYYVVANGKVEYKGNCGFDAQDEARLHKGVCVTWQNEVLWDFRPKGKRKE